MYINCKMLVMGQLEVIGEIGEEVNGNPLYFQFNFSVNLKNKNFEKKKMIS